MKAPLVTVLMPAYNSGEFLPEAIESILSQTFTEFEFLIIDDGSTDETSNIIESYSKLDKRIKVIVHQKNLGLIMSLNEAIEQIDTTYIARMDADDISKKTRLEEQVKFLQENTEVDLVATHIRIFNSLSGKTMTMWPQEKLTNSYKEILECLPEASCIAHPTIMIKTEVLKQYKYSRRQKHIEDYDLWLRLAADNRRLEKIDKILLDYRFSANSVTASDTNRLRPYFARVRFSLNRLANLKFGKFELKVYKSLVRETLKEFRAWVHKLLPPYEK